MKLSFIFLFFIYNVIGQISIIRDETDGQNYKITRIGSKSWMTENLNASFFNNGDIIPYANTIEEWNRACENMQPISCHYNFDKKNAMEFGLLYNFYAITDTRGISPKYFHIPDLEEWRTLISLNYGNRIAGFHLKSNNYLETNSFKRGLNTFNFNSIPSGVVDYNGFKNWLISYWCSDYSCYQKLSIQISAFENIITYNFETRENHSGYSVRCVSDSIFVPIDTIFVDKRDDKNYKLVHVKNQEWFAENLNTSNFLNGDVIPEAKTASEWKTASKKKLPAWCYDFRETDNGNQFGKIYNWYAITDPRGLVPEGWCIPSNKDWDILIENLSPNEAQKLKSTEGWLYRKSDGASSIFEDANGNNFSGMNILLSKSRIDNGQYYNKPYFWSSTISEKNKVFGVGIIGNSLQEEKFTYFDFNKGEGLYVRCLKKKEKNK
jgi:uncharacterized protein (TIGR02145 family)